MRTDYPSPAPPSDDRRWKMIKATMRRLGHQPHALIQTLHNVQDLFGYLDEDAFRFVAANLRVPLSKVYGVVTFYHYFQMKPKGEHTCVVCTGTACYIKGVPEILHALEKKVGLKPDETTPDNKVSLLTSRCVGACGLAPVAVMDGAMVGPLTPDEIVKRTQEWRRS